MKLTKDVIEEVRNQMGLAVDRRCGPVILHPSVYDRLKEEGWSLNGFERGPDRLPGHDVK